MTWTQFVILLSLALHTDAQQTGNAKNETSSVTIAFFLPYGMPTTNPNYGLMFQMDRLATMGVAKINESPEILPTTQVEIARVDTWANGSMSQKSNYYSGGAAAVAAEEAVGIISDFVAAYGAFWSESTKAVAGVLGKHAIPMCGDIQGDLDLSNKDAYPTFFRIYPGPGIERHILLLLEAWSVTRLVVLVGLDRKNKAVCEAMTNLLALAGIEVLSVIDIQPSQKFPKRLQPQQANNVVHLIQQYDARYILTFVDNVDLGPIYFNAKDIIGPKYVWIGIQKPYTGVYLDNNLLPLLHGFIYVTPQANTNTEPYQLLNQSWHEEYMLDPSPVLSPYLNLTAVVGAYDCVNTLLYGINKQLLQEPNESISKLEKQVQELPLYPTAFNNTGYQGAYTNPIILNTGTGDLVIAYKFIDLGSLNAFAETNLEGTFLKIIGSVQFNGAPPNSPAPPDGPPIKDPVILPDSPTGRTMLAGILLGLLITVFIAIMLIQHRSNQVFVKAAPIFSGLVLVGAALSYGSIATFMGYPTHLTCHLRLWLQLLAFIVSLSAFMIKNFRIHKIFSSRTIIPKSKLSNERFASFMMTFIFMEVVLLSAWSALSNPKSTSATTYNVNFSYQCLPNNEKLDAIMSGLLYCYNSFVLLLTAILAYLTRHVNSDYNESLFMLFFVVASALTAGPTLLALQQESDAIQRIIIRNVAIWIFTTFALIIFFAPKILAIYTFDAKPKLRLIDIISSKKYSGSTSSKGRHHHGKAMIVRPGWNKSNISSDSRRSSRWSLNETKVALDCKASTMSIFHVSEEALNSYEVLKMKNVSNEGKTISNQMAELQNNQSENAFLNVHRQPQTEMEPFDLLKKSALFQIGLKYKYETLGQIDVEISSPFIHLWSYGEVMVHSVSTKMWISVEIEGQIHCFVVTAVEKQISHQETKIYLTDSSKTWMHFSPTLKLEFETKDSALGVYNRLLYCLSNK